MIVPCHLFFFLTEDGKPTGEGWRGWTKQKIKPTIHPITVVILELIILLHFCLNRKTSILLRIGIITTTIHVDSEPNEQLLRVMMSLFKSVQRFSWPCWCFSFFRLIRSFQIFTHHLKLRSDRVLSVPWDSSWRRESYRKSNMQIEINPKSWKWYTEKVIKSLLNEQMKQRNEPELAISCNVVVHACLLESGLWNHS